MAQTRIIKQTFIDDNGKDVEYERLAISGYVSGEIQTLEIKLSKSELLLAKILLNSDEEAPSTETRQANAQEQAEFQSNVTKTPAAAQGNFLDDED